MLGFSTLTQKYLNLTLGSKQKMQTRIIERPGLWMSDDELKKLSADLRDVVGSLGIGDLAYGALNGDRARLENSVFTIIYDNQLKRAMAFNALSIMSCTLKGQQVDVVHLGLVVINPEIRAKGLSWILYGFTTFLLFFRNRLKPIWVSNVTQVPSIIGMCSESFGNVFPNPRLKNRRSFEHLLLAREIMSKHRHVFGVGEEAEFDEEKFIMKNSYTGGSDNLKKTFEQAPKHREPLYNDFCKDHLDYNRGDDFLQLGQIDLKTFYHYLLHSAPPSAVITIAYRTIFALIESICVPTIQWFSPSKQMGELRPWK